MKKLFVTLIVSLVLTGSGTCFAAHPTAAAHHNESHPASQQTIIEYLPDCQGAQCLEKSTSQCCQQVSGNVAPSRSSIQQKHKKNKYKTGKVPYEDPKVHHQSLQTAFSRRGTTFSSIQRRSFSGVIKTVQKRE